MSSLRSFFLCFPCVRDTIQQISIPSFQQTLVCEYLAFTKLCHKPFHHLNDNVCVHKTCLVEEEKAVSERVPRTLAVSQIVVR